MPALNYISHLIVISLTLLLCSCSTCLKECNKNACSLNSDGALNVKLHFSDRQIGDFQCYVIGEGSPVLLMHELPGMTPATIELAMELSQKHRVYMPLFFGEFGNQLKDNLGAIVSVSLSEDWNFFGKMDVGRVRENLKKLTHQISMENGNARIAVIGNCMSGNLPFELIAEDSVGVAVICQPAIPLSILPNRNLGLSKESIEKTQEVVANNPFKKVYFFHYFNDKKAPIERTAEMLERLVNNIPKEGNSDRIRAYIAIKESTLNRIREDNLKPFGCLQNYVEWLKVENDKGHSTVTIGCDKPSSLEGPYRHSQMSDKDMFRGILSELLSEK